MTYREYLQSAYFAVIQEVATSRVSEFSEALTNPVFDLYLGRKNCVPTDFIFKGVYPSEEAAREAASLLAQEKGLKKMFEILEGEHDGEVLVLNDVPEQFGQFKKYHERSVTVVRGFS